MRREDRHPDADRHLERGLVAVAEGPPPDGRADPLRRLHGTLLVGLREDHDELLAAVACDRVDVADLREETGRAATPLTRDLNLLEEVEAALANVEPDRTWDLAVWINDKWYPPKQALVTPFSLRKDVHARGTDFVVSDIQPDAREELDGFDAAMVAIEMANVYMRNGEDELLRNMAWEVAFVQSGDIRVMQNALGKWGKTGNPDVAMEWMGMRGVAQDAQPGMATDDEMAALEQARGRELDDLFTRLMMNHHAGGVHMASAAAARARIGDVRQFARLMASAQQFEIGEFDFARKQLGLPSYEPKL